MQYNRLHKVKCGFPGNGSCTHFHDLKSKHSKHAWCFGIVDSFDRISRKTNEEIEKKKYKKNNSIEYIELARCEHFRIANYSITTSNSRHGYIKPTFEHESGDLYLYRVVLHIIVDY